MLANKQNLKKLVAAYGEAFKFDSAEYSEKLQAAIKKIFPESACVVRENNSLSPSIQISFTYGLNRNEFANGISHNDPGHFIGFLWPQEDKIKVEANIYGLRNPQTYKMFPETKFRKKTGTPDQIKAHILKYFENLKKVTLDNLELFPKLIQDKVK